MPLELLPYQVRGASVIAQQERFGLHDEMGVGKTAQVIRAAELIGAERGIIIAPAFLRENWIGEWRKFGTEPRRLCKGQNIHDFVAWMRGRFHILVTSYEQATKWAPQIHASGEVIDFVAIDEAHYLKDAGSKRTKAIQGDDLEGSGGAIEWAQHVWHVTGTPMANDPLDIFTFLKLCQAMPLSKEAFMKRYFHVIRTKFGSRQEPIPHMIPELKGLIDAYSIRRLKTDPEVDLQLPPIFMTTALVDGDATDIVAMLRDYPGLEQAIVRALEQGGLSFLDSQHIATLRRLVGQSKVVPYGHILLEELQASGEKRVVYGIHRDALQDLRDFLVRNGVKAVLVQGGVSEALRVEAVRSFQNDADCRVFIGNIRAAGTGITLTASCEIDILESDWTPAGNAQAIMRVHRIGQTRNVRARFITLAKSIDEIVNRIVAAKTAAIASIEGEAMSSMPLDVLSA